MSSPFTFPRAPSSPPPAPAPARPGESHADRVKREACASFGLVARLFCGESRLVVGEDEEIHELSGDRESAEQLAGGGVVIDTTADVCPTCGGSGRLGVSRDHEIVCPVCTRSEVPR